MAYRLRLRVLRRDALALLSAALLCMPHPVFACAVCFGEAEGAQARGATLGVVTLGLITLIVLVAFAVFFVKLALKSSSGKIV